MNTEYRRYEVKVGNNVVVMECDDFNVAVSKASEVNGLVFDNYEFAIVFRA